MFVYALILSHFRVGLRPHGAAVVVEGVVLEAGSTHGLRACVGDHVEDGVDVANYPEANTFTFCFIVEPLVKFVKPLTPSPFFLHFQDCGIDEVEDHVIWDMQQTSRIVPAPFS